MPSLQEVFDRTATHLFTMGSQCKGRDTCRYRNGDKKCAVGLWIPDDRYTPSIEGQTLFGFDGARHEIVALLPSEMNKPEILNLLRRLQTTHDDPPNWRSTGAMRLQLRSVAAFYVLDASILDDLQFEDR